MDSDAPIPIGVRTLRSASVLADLMWQQCAETAEVYMQGFFCRLVLSIMLALLVFAYMQILFVSNERLMAYSRITFE